MRECIWRDFSARCPIGCSAGEAFTSAMSIGARSSVKGVRTMEHAKTLCRIKSATAIFYLRGFADLESDSLQIDLISQY
jgi:hypothetical protein